MDVRDAVEADAERMAQLTGSPTDVMRNLVHDRTVRIACESTDGSRATDEASDVGGDGESDDRGGARDAGDGGDLGIGDDRETRGFVSFDAQRQTVHVTQIDGDREACARLLKEPIRFARQEGMSVELLVAEDNDDLRSIATDAGFTDHGAGPRFGSTSTVRYRMDP